MESISRSEFLLGIEEYLRYLDKDNNADSVHTLARTIDSKESSVKAFMQELSGQLQDTNRSYSDLLHGTAKANDLTDIYKNTIQFIGKNLVENKHMSDMIHSVLKSTDMIIIYKAILQFVGKTLKNDLALAISRSIDSNEFENDFIKAYLASLDRQFLTDKIFRGINNYLKLDLDKNVINDAFSRSQIKSKIWLIEELENVRQKLDDPVYKNVLVMAGWFGQLKSIYDKKLTYRKMRIAELDGNSCEISDYVFNLAELENYKVKAVNVDINGLTLHKNGYEWDVRNFRDEISYSEKFLPDLIINTSAEHMTDEWYKQIRFKDMESNPIVAIQSNNLFDIPEHINCVHSVDHMKKKFPMKEILFEGELQLKGYKRVMLIGRP